MEALVLNFLITISASLTVHGANASCGFPPGGAPPNWSSANFYQAHPNPGISRELAVIEQVMKGNVPNSLRQFVPVQMQTRINNTNAVLELSVSPDYLAIGTDTDWVRTPLTPFAAQYIASELGYFLPTRRLVDLIYDRADTQLLPQPTDWYKNGLLMRLGPNYVLFHNMIEDQRKGRGGLIAGHKKDVVLTNLLDRAPARVAIYGWQRPGNKPIQPLGTPHNFDYEDYSHGIRFIGPTLKITYEGKSPQTLPMLTALRDPKLGGILSGSQGPIHDVRAGRTCPSSFAAALGLSRANCPPQPHVCDSEGNLLSDSSK